MKKIKLTPAVLKRIIAEEKAKLKSLGMIKSQKESIVEKKLEAIEKLSIEENSLRRKLKRISEAKQKIKKSFAKK